MRRRRRARRSVPIEAGPPGAGRWLWLTRPAVSPANSDSPRSGHDPKVTWPRAVQRGPQRWPESRSPVRVLARQPTAGTNLVWPTSSRGTGRLKVATGATIMNRESRHTNAVSRNRGWSRRAIPGSRDAPREAVARCGPARIMGGRHGLRYRLHRSLLRPPAGSLGDHVWFAAGAWLLLASARCGPGSHSPSACSRSPGCSVTAGRCCVVSTTPPLHRTGRRSRRARREYANRRRSRSLLIAGK